MKLHRIFAAVLGLLSAAGPMPLRGGEPLNAVEVAELIFDNEASDLAEGVQIVNGKIVLTGTTATKPDKSAQPDPAGAQVLELTDGSQLHGQIENLGKSELVWKRSDTTAPLIFAPQDVQRITLTRAASAPAQKANATLKLHGGDWLTGNLTSFENGTFHLDIDGAGTVQIERGKVEWIHLSKTNPPDAYEGPLGPMGLAGWDTGGSGAWDYADGALAARAAAPVTRQFDFLPERMDLEFSAGDGGNAIRGLTLWIQPGLQQRGYSKGSVYLRFQGNNVSVNSYDGNNMKNLSANVPADKKPPKETRYRLLQDKRSGKLIVFVNGAKVADWDLQPQKEPIPGGSLSWQPTYWSSNLAWTLSKIRVRPWDGGANPDAQPDEVGKDLLINQPTIRKQDRNAGWPIVNGQRVASSSSQPPQKEVRLAASLEAISAESVRFSGRDISRMDPIFIRLAAGQSADPPPGAVARVWLTQRGEFDVTGLGIRDGQLKVRTSFGGDISLPLTAVRAIEFPHRLSGADKNLADTGDTIIFRNSDELRGTLVSATHDQSVKWQPVKGDRIVEFSVNRIAGILLAKKTKPATTTNTAAVRFRNGDWLQGEMMLLSKDQLIFKSPLADNLQLKRSGIRAIYFGQNGEIPFWDGTIDRQLWTKGFPVGQRFSSSSGQRKDDADRQKSWRYLDGSFTLPDSFNRSGNGNGPTIGRVFDSLPDKVEVSFELSTPGGPAGYAVQLFSEENRPGLMVQGSWDSAYIYDMSPRNQGGGFFNQPQQVEFGEKVDSEGNRRHFRFLAERKTGRLVMIVNGVPVGQFGQRSGKESPKPGKGISINPQQMNSGVTISNLWIGPWSGDAPHVPKTGPRPDGRAGKDDEINPPASAQKDSKAKSATAAPLASDLITLVNGDESTGVLEKATASELSLKCDVGTLDVPRNRTLMVEFAGAPERPASGIRLHLAGKGTLTVDSLNMADGKVVCHSATAGDLTFTSEAVSEIIFQPRNLPPPAKPENGNARNKPGNNINGNIIIQGGGGLQIQGNVIINGGGVIIEGR